MPFYLVTGKRILFNCWDTLKTVRLQHNNETCASVNVAKAEKTDCIAYGESLSVVEWAISSQDPNRVRFNDYRVNE